MRLWENGGAPNGENWWRDTVRDARLRATFTAMMNAEQIKQGETA